MWSDLTLGPSFKVKLAKRVYNLIIKMLFIFKTMLLVFLRWIHLAYGHRYVLGLVENSDLTEPNSHHQFMYFSQTTMLPISGLVNLAVN